MKKIKILIALAFVSIAVFAQETTMTTQFHKIKVGHSVAYTDASELFINKFSPQMAGKTVSLVIILQEGNIMEKNYTPMIEVKVLQIGIIQLPYY